MNLNVRQLVGFLGNVLGVDGVPDYSSGLSNTPLPNYKPSASDSGFMLKSQVIWCSKEDSAESVVSADSSDRLQQRFSQWCNAVENADHYHASKSPAWVEALLRTYFADPSLQLEQISVSLTIEGDAVHYFSYVRGERPELV